MNKTKWTPGPWRIDECNTVGIFNQSYSITALDPIEQDPDERIIICQLPTGQGKFSKQFHNARLIAKAPEMAEALKRVMDFEQRISASYHDGGTSLCVEIKSLLNAINDGGAM